LRCSRVLRTDLGPADATAHGSIRSLATESLRRLAVDMHLYLTYMYTSFMATHPGIAEHVATDQLRRGWQEGRPKSASPPATTTTTTPAPT